MMSMRVRNLYSLLGFVFALAAAALNATIGVFSVLLMNTGLKSNDIAFFKTIIAFVLLSALLSKIPKRIQYQHLITSEFTSSSNKSSN